MTVQVITSVDELEELRHGDDELDHAGVKGMKWGQRKAEAGGRTAAIAQARSDLGDTADAAIRAKALYQKKVGTKGEARAKAALQKANMEYRNTADAAYRQTGKEQVATALAAAGGVALVIGFSALTSRR